MRIASYIILGISGFLFVLFASIWFIGLVAGQTFGGLLHLFLIMAMTAIPVFAVGVILLIVSFVQKPK